MEGDCESKENAFISLPPEVIMGIFLELPIPDGARLAQTCKKLHSVFSIELFWEKKILREFGIDLSRSSQKCDEKYPSHFYKSVLHKYGQVLGLWQRTSFSYYGSMVQGVYEDWSLKLIEWFPPILGNIFGSLRSRDFLRISMKNSDEHWPSVKLTRLDNSLYLDCKLKDGEEEDIVMVVNSSTRDKLSIYLSSIGDFGADPQVFHQMLVSFINYQTGETFTDLAEEMTLRLLTMLGPCIEKFNTKMNCRGVHAFVRIPPELSVFRPDPHEKPIPRGIFVGIYGSHGHELIMVNYPTKDKIEGVKITGDPNVPMNKTTFTADLSKSIVMTESFQKEATCQDLIDGIEELSVRLLSICEPAQLTQAFVLPPDTQIPLSTQFTECLYRFIGEGQIAELYYNDPQMVPAHLIVFDCDTFGVLFLTLKTMSLYSRVKQNLNAIHYEDTLATM